MGNTANNKSTQEKFSVTFLIDKKSENKVLEEIVDFAQEDIDDEGVLLVKIKTLKSEDGEDYLDDVLENVYSASDAGFGVFLICYKDPIQLDW